MNKARNIIRLVEEEGIKLLEWRCPKCETENIPDEGQCSECGYQVQKEFNDQLRKTYEAIYNKVYNKIHGKLFEDDLKSSNEVKFVTKLREMGILRRLRSGRFIEVLKIPKEMMIGCFVEGKEGMKRLRKMAWRRKQNIQPKEGRIQRFQMM